MAELRKASFSKAAFWLAVAELRCSFVMLSFCEGNGLNVEFDFTLVMPGADCAEVGRVAGGGRRVDELMVGCTRSSKLGVQFRGTDSVTEIRAFLLYEDPRERADEVEEA